MDMKIVPALAYIGDSNICKGKGCDIKFVACVYCLDVFWIDHIVGKGLLNFSKVSKKGWDKSYKAVLYFRKSMNM